MGCVVHKEKLIKLFGHVTGGWGDTRNPKFQFWPWQGEREFLSVPRIGSWAQKSSNIRHLQGHIISAYIVYVHRSKSSAYITSASEVTNTKKTISA